MKILLCSTYDLGHQPFGLASPAAILAAEGHEVHCADLSVDPWPAKTTAKVDLVAFYLPMHTATLMSVPFIEQVRASNPDAHLCCYGLYAPLNAGMLRNLGVATLLGGEFETGLVSLANRLSSGNGAIQSEPLISLDHIPFQVPERSLLPPLERYAALRIGEKRKTVGYTEASRGCKHHCRHCPVVPVYNGRFRVVPLELVLADVRRMIEAGAEHITFGDPDFFNGPTHAVRLVENLHREFPEISYDATIKIEHLLRHRDLLPSLKRTGCMFVTSAVESMDDTVLEKLKKQHTRSDFVQVVASFREIGLTLAPTFIAFTPWTTWEGYRDLLRILDELDLIENVAPIQLALRLLVTWNSGLLELEDIRRLVGPFDQSSLVYRWRHPDPSVDELSARLLKLVADMERGGRGRTEIFAAIWEIVHGARPTERLDRVSRTTIPYLEEPWYC